LSGADFALKNTRHANFRQPKEAAIVVIRRLATSLQQK